MPERYRGKPLNTYVDIGRGLASTWQVKISSFGRTSSNKYSVETLLQHRLHGLDMALLKANAKIEDVAHLFVDNFHRQTESRNLRPDHAAWPMITIKNRHFIAQRS